MQKSPQNQISFRLGDKVRIRSGKHAKARGIISAETDGLLEIILETNETTRVALADIVNYSLAARKAWKTMAERSIDIQK